MHLKRLSCTFPALRQNHSLTKSRKVAEKLNHLSQSTRYIHLVWRTQLDSSIASVHDHLSYTEQTDSIMLYRKNHHINQFQSMLHHMLPQLIWIVVYQACEVDNECSTDASNFPRLHASYVISLMRLSFTLIRPDSLSRITKQFANSECI